MSVDSFKVVGCGLPRTGTLSVAKALEHILGGKCHHGYEVLHERGRKHLDFWTEFSRSETKNLDQLRTFLMSHGYTAGVDCPFTFHYKEILEAFPEAKVLLTVRDPASWYKSYAHFLKQFYQSRKSWTMMLIQTFHGKSAFHDIIEDKLADMILAGERGEDAAITFFNNWIECIKADVPGDKLLIYDVRDGWAPLCKFLGVPIPDNEFPHLNSSEAIFKVMSERAHPAWMAVLTTFCVLIALFAFVFKYWILQHEFRFYSVAMLVLIVIFALILICIAMLWNLSKAVEQYRWQ